MIRPVLHVGRRAIPLGRTRSTAYSLPPPIGGWNARDALANIPESEAIQLDNLFPGNSHVEVRNGHTSHATGLTDPVETLMAYNAPGSEKLFAAAGANIFDVTNTGAVGAAVQSSLTSARWQYSNFGNSAGQFLYLVNGADAPRYYDGSSWTTPTITGSGLTASNLVNITLFKRRLLFCENNKLGFWYFPVETLAGSIAYFDLSPLFSLGGYLMAIGTWTRDGGSGMDDYAVFITSRGELAVYQGTDPSDSSAWSLVGVFNVGPPVGRRAVIKLGAELLILTKDGAAFLSSILGTDRISERSYVSDKIANAWRDSVQRYGALFGWQPFFYPAGNMLVINVPLVENSEVQQYVSNTTNGAWCRFKDLNAFCWELFSDVPYFGGDGEVFQADNSQADAGANINAEAQTAFSYLKRRGVLKKFNMARLILSSDDGPYVAMEALADFDQASALTTTPVFTEPTGSDWDTAEWDVASWSDIEQIVKNWQTIDAMGYAVSIHLQTTSKNGSLKWHSTDVLYEPGGLV